MGFSQPSRVPDSSDPWLTKSSLSGGLLGEGEKTTWLKHASESAYVSTYESETFRERSDLTLARDALELELLEEERRDLLRRPVLIASLESSSQTGADFNSESQSIMAAYGQNEPGKNET